MVSDDAVDTAWRYAMRNAYKLILAFCLMTVLSLAGLRQSVLQPRHDAAPAFHTMFADGDIGDGTSPAKKG